MKYFVKIGDQLTEVPEEITKDDQTVRSAFVAYYPDVSAAEVKRTVNGDEQTIELIKRAGPKG